MKCSETEMVGLYHVSTDRFELLLHHEVFSNGCYFVVEKVCKFIRCCSREKCSLSSNQQFICHSKKLLAVLALSNFSVVVIGFCIMD